MHEHSSLSRIGTLKKQYYLGGSGQKGSGRLPGGPLARYQLSPPSPSSAGFCSGMRTTREGTTVEMACL